MYVSSPSVLPSFGARYCRGSAGNKKDTRGSKEREYRSKYMYMYMYIYIHLHKCMHT